LKKTHKTNIHDNRVNTIFNDPKRIGLEDIVWKAKEVKLYERNDLSYVADLVFIEDKTGLFVPRWVVVEYKCHDSPRNRSKENG